MIIRLFKFVLVCLFFSASAFASKIFIPMDAEGQTNHLKAYGIAFAALKAGTKVDWFLNYKGGSFGMEYSKALDAMCKDRNVVFVKMKDNEYKTIINAVKGAKYDSDVIQLEKAPRIAVYTPLNKEPWDDAVTIALTYAEIPFEKVYVDEVLNGDLSKYDWLHLHHEDFTGQFGKFWYQFRAQQWYQNDQMTLEHLAKKHGFKKVQQMQLAVVKKMNAFMAAGGSLFAMCTATETYDIALAADGIDICETQFDNDPMDPEAQSKLNFNNCLAFTNFTISTNPYETKRSNIDVGESHKISQELDVFTLSHFPAKLDQVPAMLCQNHTTTIKGFMGLTTAFRDSFLKPQVLVMGECKPLNEAKYIHGDYGKGSWTFYGGHDPEDYRHVVNAPPTNLGFHSSSPGYRLILNNVLCYAAKKQDVPTVTLTKTPKTEPSMAQSESTSDNHKIQITPNPANNELILTPAGNTKTGTVIIKNANGIEVLNQSFTSAPFHVDLKDLPAGVFLIEVNGVFAGKVRKD